LRALRIAKEEEEKRVVLGKDVAGKKNSVTKRSVKFTSELARPASPLDKQRLDCAIEGSLIGSKAKKRAGRLAVPMRIIAIRARFVFEVEHHESMPSRYTWEIRPAQDLPSKSRNGCS
jgi:hypothetical protein